MVTFVKSRAGNIFLRHMIRRTWGSLLYVNGGQFSTIFIVGRTKNATIHALVEEEYERNRDLMLIDETDDYLYVSVNFYDLTVFSKKKHTI